MQFFWFEFEGDFSNLPPGLAIGCGVTAYDYEDAVRILDEKVFRNFSRPPFRIQLENITIDDLDVNHVIPNMKSLISYGVWFPLGYD